MPPPLRRLLWTDCLAGAVVGVLVLALAGWLSALYRLPVALIRFSGGANLVYAAFSFTLARQPYVERGHVLALSVANGAWAALCLLGAIRLWGESSGFGLAHLVLEAAFVGGLAFWEARWSRALSPSGGAPE